MQSNKGNLKIPRQLMKPSKKGSTLQCPNGCGPLRAFHWTELAGQPHGWECTRSCGYYYETKHGAV